MREEVPNLTGATSDACSFFESVLFGKFHSNVDDLFTKGEHAVIAVEGEDQLIRTNLVQRNHLDSQ